MPELTKDQILDGLKRAHRSLPTYAAIVDPNEETMVWLGRTHALLGKISSSIRDEVDNVQNYAGAPNEYHERQSTSSYTKIKQILVDAITLLELEVGSFAVAFEPGAAFDYFDQTRKIIESAEVEIFLIDPYVDADIVSTYFRAIKPSVTIRILTSNRQHGLNSIIPALEKLNEQSGVNIEVKSTDHLHDRFWLIDCTHGYQSSSSIKDGGKKSAALIMEIRDAFDSVQGTYETKWNAATSKFAT